MGVKKGVKKRKKKPRKKKGVSPSLTQSSFLPFSEMLTERLLFPLARVFVFETTDD